MGSYAIVSDIHGDLDALKRVWSQIQLLQLDSKNVFNAGDTVAYGDSSSACIDFVRSLQQIVSVGGNYDINVARFPDDQERFERKWKVRRPEKYIALQEASLEISESQRKWLKDLPSILEFTIDGKTVALCHYSPVGNKVGLGTWTDDAVLLQVAAVGGYDIVMTGHTHTPFVRRAGNTLFINPGSVGRSWGRPTFAVMTIEDEQVRAEVLT